MSRRTDLTTHDYLINAPLPEQTESYTVIPHGDVIDLVKRELLAKGFAIERELYRCNAGAQIAQGIYHLKYGEDKDMGLMFAWSNSYDKSMRFRCVMGAYVHVTLSSIVGDNMAAYARRHTGVAHTDVINTVQQQIAKADEYFTKLVADKEAMKKIKASKEECGAVLGRMYFVNEIFTTEQMSVIRQELKKPSFKHDGGCDTVWALYNTIIYALQKSHPRTWLDQQLMAHYMICNFFNLNLINFQPELNEVPVQESVAPSNQLDLIEELEKVETIDSLDDLEQRANIIRGEVPVSSQTAMPDLSEVSPEVKQEEKEEEVLVDENSWPCLGCGRMQGANDPFYEGQLCSDCNSKN